jgi:hypothetical protein
MTNSLKLKSAVESEDLDQRINLLLRSDNELACELNLLPPANK